MLTLNDLMHTLASPMPEGQSELDRVLESARAAHGPGALEDDFTILKLAI